MNWINYILESTVILFLFFLLYIFLFRRIKWLEFNRFYLLITLIISIALPLTESGFLIPTSDPLIIYVDESINRFIDIPISSISSTNSIDLSYSYFAFLYVLVSGLLFILFAWNLYTIRRITKNNLSPDNQEIAFSFLNKIYIHPAIKDREEYDLILQHEKAHANQLHSFDILLLEFLKIIFWMNPFIWIFKMLVRENHEYLADQVVSKKYPERINNYKQQILSFQLTSYNPNLLNSFNFLHYKKRLDMITKESPQTIKKGMHVLYFLLALVFVFACENGVDLRNSKEVALNQKESNIIIEDFYTHFKKNIKYPSEARRNNVQVKYYVAFKVLSNGQISDIKIHDEMPANLSELKEVVVVGYSSGTENGEETAAVKKAFHEALTESVGGFRFSQGNEEKMMVLPVQFKLS